MYFLTCSHYKCSVWSLIETSTNHFKVVDCYFFGTGSPWSCLLTPKRGINSYLNEIYALYIVQVKCTCSLVPVLLFLQDIEWFKLHWIKPLCLKFYFNHNHQWNLIWFKWKIEGLKMGCSRKNPHTPDGWDSGNSRGRGGRRLRKSRREGGLTLKKSSAGVISTDSWYKSNV